MTFRPYHDAQHQSLDHILQADYIEEKGEGRVILLHGPPGLGKTYTVECIAEYSGKCFKAAKIKLTI
jgi:DNA polymerase III delta prime subunit